MFGYQITLVRLVGIRCSRSLALGLLYLLLNRTRFGRAVRATVQNPESARLLGVEAGPGVAALGFGLGAATAAAAGSVYGLLYPFNSGSHYDLISRLLSIVVLGGLGSIGGCRRRRAHRLDVIGGRRLDHLADLVGDDVLRRSCCWCC